MPSRHVSVRQKLGPARTLSKLNLLAALEDEKESQPVLHDLIMGCAGLCFNVMFAVGSICFFSEKTPVLQAGDWLFIVGSIGVFLTSGWQTLECLAARRAQGLDEHEKDEVMESIHYCASAFIFAAGSVLFMPNLYGSDTTAEFWGHEWGAWLFTTGSLGFLSAAYWNALGLATKRARAEDLEKHPALSEAEERCSRIASIELWILLTASALFVVGSFLYRPSLETHCPEEVRRVMQEQEQTEPTQRSMLHSGKFQSQHPTLRVSAFGGTEPAMPMCLSPAVQGTYMYTVGSFMFVGDSLMCLARTWIMSSAHGEANALPTPKAAAKVV